MLHRSRSCCCLALDHRVGEGEELGDEFDPCLAVDVVDEEEEKSVARCEMEESETAHEGSADQAAEQAQGPQHPNERLRRWPISAAEIRHRDDSHGMSAARRTGV